ncbi:hypothetical protein Bca101_051924 [Brassica carinata]
MNLCYHILSYVLKLPHFFTPKVAGGVTAAGMYAGLRASGKKPNLALVTCDVGAVAAGPNASYLCGA